MGLERLVGLGLLYGARDDGAISLTERLSTTVRDLGRSISRSGDDGAAGFGRLNGAINALSLAQLTRVSDAVENLANRVESSNNIASTSLESWGAQFSQTYRQATAGMGEFRAIVDEQRGEISGLAFSLQIGAEGMLAVASAAARAGYSLEDYGLSMRAVAGLEQAGIIQGQELGGMLTNLSESYGLGAERAGQLLNNIVALGERAGVGADALRSMPQVMTAMDEVTRRFPDMAGNADGVAQSIMRLATATQRGLGGTFESNIQGAIGVFNQLGQSRGELQGLIAGLSSDFPQLAQQIATATGNVGLSIDAIMSDPMRFAGAMAESYRAMDENSIQAIHLREALLAMGPQFSFLVMGGERSQRALEAATMALDGTSGALTRLGESAAGSTRTFAEAMDLLQESFMTRVNTTMTRLGRTQAEHLRGYRNFERQVLTRQREAYQNLGRTIDNVASGRGPMGTFARMALSMRRGGVAGLTLAIENELGNAFPGLQERIRDVLPMIGELGAGVLEVAQNSGPLILAMTQMGMMRHVTTAFRLILNPVTLLAGGFYLLYRYGDRIPALMSDIASRLTNFADVIERFVAGTDWTEFGQNIVDGLVGSVGDAADSVNADSPAAAKIGRAIQRILGAAWTVVRGLVGGMWSRFADWLMEPTTLVERIRRGAVALGATAGVALGATLLSPMRGAVLSVFGRGISSLGPRIIGLFGRFGTGIAQALVQRGVGGVARGAAASLLRGIPGLGAIIGVLFDLPDIISSFQTGGIVAGLRTTFESIVNSLLLGIPGIIEGLTGTDLVNRIFDFLFEGLNVANIVEAIQSGNIAQAFIEGWMGLTGGGFARLIWGRIFGQEAVDTAMAGVGNIVSEIGGGLWDATTTFIDSLAPLWTSTVESYRQVGGVFSDLWYDTIAPLISEIGGMFSGLFGETTVADDGVANIATTFDTVQDSVWSFGETVSRVINDYVAPAIIWLSENVIPLVVTAAEYMAEGFRRGVYVIRGVMRLLSPIFRIVWDTISGLGRFIWWWWENVTFPVFDMLRRTFTPIFRALVRIGRWAFGIIGDAVTWWWENVTSPVLNFLYTVGRRIFQGLTWLVGDAFEAMGGYVTWWWEHVTLPVLGWLRDTFQTVVGAIVGAVRTAFNWIAEFITARIEDAGAAFYALGASWDAIKNYLSAGFRLIGAEIGEFLTVPFLRLQGVLVSIPQMIRAAFLAVKLGVFSMLETIITGLQGLARGLGPIGSALANTLDQPLRSVRDSMTATRTEQRTISQEAERENARRRGEIEAVQQETERRRQETEQAAAVAQSALLRGEGEYRARAARERQNAAQREEAEGAAQQARVEGRRAARGRRRGPALPGGPAAEARPADVVAESIRRVANVPGLSQEERSRFEGIIRSAASRGEVDPEIVAEVAAEVAGTRGRAARERAFQQMETEVGLGGGGGEEATQETRGRARAQQEERQTNLEQSRQAEATAAVERAIEIASFGPAAQRQLRDAMRGGAGARGPAPRPRPPTAPDEGVNP